MRLMPISISTMILLQFIIHSGYVVCQVAQNFLQDVTLGKLLPSEQETGIKFIGSFANLNRN